MGPVGLPCLVVWCVKEDPDEVIDEAVGLRSDGCWDLDRQRHRSSNGDFWREKDGIGSLRFVWALEVSMIPFLTEGDLDGEIRDHFEKAHQVGGLGDPPNVNRNAM
jgi:hypothetical protein